MSAAHPLDQREMTASWGYEVLWLGGIGSFVGEWMGLLRDGDRWGLLWIGHTSSTDRDDYELALPGCSWDCRRDPACPHDWSAIEALSAAERRTIEWYDAAGVLARLRQVRDTWDGPSSVDSARHALDAMIGLARAGAGPDGRVRA